MKPGEQVDTSQVLRRIAEARGITGSMGGYPLHSLFRQGAFQGTSASEAYFVKCDSDTTTQDDINRGVVNVVVGFAPLKPAEFVVIKLQQMAGQA